MKKTAEEKVNHKDGEMKQKILKWAEYIVRADELQPFCWIDSIF